MLAIDRVLTGQVHQLDVVGITQHGLAETRHRGEGAGQVDLLEGARAEYLGVDLPGQRQYRRAVDLRIPQAGQHVGRTGTGDTHAGRRFA